MKNFKQIVCILAFISFPVSLQAAKAVVEEGLLLDGIEGIIVNGIYRGIYQLLQCFVFG